MAEIAKTSKGAAKKRTVLNSKPKARMISIRWYRSAIATPVKHKRIVKGLGFTRLNQVIERQDTPSIRGMVKKIPHLLRIEGDS